MAQIDSGNPYSTANHDKVVIGYVPNWDAWKGLDFNIPKGSLNHYNIDYSQYTLLNFSFFGVAVDGSLHSGDLRANNIYQEGVIQQPDDLLHPDAYSSHDQAMVLGVPQEFWGWDEALRPLGYEPNPDGAYLGWVKTETGETGEWPLIEYPTPGMISIAHDNGVKVMASIGGWSMCKHFPEVAADPVKRARFIQDCVTLIEDYNFDGIDIDWEFPGPFAGMNFTGSEADYHNFTVLMEDIREAIGPDKLVTAAFNMSPTKLRGLEWQALDQVMDYYNIMSYDLNGGWSAKAGHNSPLYAYPDQEWGAFSWHDTFIFLRDSMNVSPSKINMGVAFYGRGVTTETTAALHAPTLKKSQTFSVDGPVVSAADTENWTVTEGSPYFFQIQEAIASGTWTKHWDDDAKVPYLTKDVNGKHYFLSYDDEESIALKSQYVVDNDIAGVIIWQIFSDWKVGAETSSIASRYPICPDTKPELAHVVNKVFAEGSGPVNPAPQVTLNIPASVSQETFAPVALQATVTDDKAGVSVTVSVDGTALSVSNTGDVYEASWTPSAYGSVVVRVEATDAEGKQTVRSSTVEVLDPSQPNVAPTVGFVSPQDNAVIQQETLSAVAVEVLGEDTDGTVESVEISVDGQVFTTSSASWTPSAFGVYTLTAKVTDNEGAEGQSSITVTIEEIVEDTTTTGTCELPEYAPYPTIYQSGDQVVYEGIKYEAKVDNLYNVVPGTAAHYWEDLGACGDVVVVPPCPNGCDPVVTLTTTTGTVKSELPYTINLSATSSDEDGTVSSTVYTVNGTTVSGSSYAVTAYGTYTVVVTVTDNDGRTASDQGVVTVEEPADTSDCTAAAWDANATYTGGEIVVYEGILYKAKWWSEDDVPSENNGSGKEWEVLGPCGSARFATKAIDATSLTAYPNPFTQALKVTLGGKTINSLKVMNATGQLIESATPANGTYTLNTGQWNTGIYILLVEAEGTLFTTRVLKK
ncbi:hypothetical protein GCM10023331_05630 [Algivirga pacifica]|uniref:chitinase n=2 Tax=Algivirga pacifica TaxID=1162670 RepID=A0ABP9D676_9BACT